MKPPVDETLEEVAHSYVFPKASTPQDDEEDEELPGPDEDEPDDDVKKLTRGFRNRAT